jgi:hypothetical protein
VQVAIPLVYLALMAQQMDAQTAILKHPSFLTQDV